MGLKNNIWFLLKTLPISAVLLMACIEFEPVSPVPAINFRNIEIIEVYDTLLEQYVKVAELEFEFTDGDADFGVYPEIISAPNEVYPDSAKYNFIVTFQDKIEGVYAPKIFWNALENRTDTLIIEQTIKQDPKMDRVGQNKTIKGSITAGIQLEQLKELQDTFRLEFFIRDRAYNRSNIDYSDDVFIEQ